MPNLSPASRQALANIIALARSRPSADPANPTMLDTVAALAVLNLRGANGFWLAQSSASAADAKIAAANLDFVPTFSLLPATVLPNPPPNLAPEQVAQLLAVAKKLAHSENLMLTLNPIEPCEHPVPRAGPVVKPNRANPTS